MNKVIEKLKEYSDQIDLTSRFKDDFEVQSSIFNKTEKQKLLKEETRFDRNVCLKWILSEKYKKFVDTTSLDFWIINEWGGIKNFKPTDKNLKKIKVFKKEILNRRLSKDSFSTISSLSKVSSFLNPDDFVIYDSRVIYTLNWLILTCENQESFKEKYYPLPSGRNKVISNFDMNTILNISHMPEYKQKRSIFISQQEAYFDFCSFIKKATKEIFGKNAKPYELEILLFIMADIEIFDEIKKRLKLSIS